MDEQLNELVKQLAKARKNAEELTTEAYAMICPHEKKIAEIKSSPEYREIKEEFSSAVLLVDKLEADVRKMAIQDFFISNQEDKHPHEAVEIKIGKSVTISNGPNLKEWCLHNFTPALEVNVKEIEKAAKNGNIPADLVLVESEAKANISRDLSKYLEAT